MSTPNCYGKSWDPTDVQCKGGLNPLYKSRETGSHVQPQCVYYQPCAQATCAGKAQTGPTVIPVQNLTRPVVTPAPAAAPPQATPPQLTPPAGWRPPQVAPVAPKPPNPFATQLAAHVGHYAPQYLPQVTQVLLPPAVAQYGPQQVPVNYAVPHSQMPSYLAIPEPILEGVPWYRRLFHEMFRAAVKSSCHQGASFFDHNPIHRYPH